MKEDIFRIIDELLKRTPSTPIGGLKLLRLSCQEMKK